MKIHLPDVFDLEELTILVNKVNEVLSEMYTGVFEAITHKLLTETKQRIQKSVSDVLALMIKKDQPDMNAAEASRNRSFIYRYKLSIICTIIFCVYLYITIKKNEKSHQKKIA